MRPCADVSYGLAAAARVLKVFSVHSVFDTLAGYWPPGSTAMDGENAHCSAGRVVAARPLMLGSRTCRGLCQAENICFF